MAAKPKRSLKSSRIERDSLGAVEVQHKVLYGIHTTRARHLNFSGKPLHRYYRYLEALLHVKIAAARANREAGIIDARIAAAIESACREVRNSPSVSDFVADVLSGGGGIAINMNLNEVIANAANEALGQPRGSYSPVHPKLHVNASQSTADVCHTAARIGIVNSWVHLHEVMADCVSALGSKAEEFHDVQTLARTCLRDASVTSLGEMFGAYAAGLARRLAELHRAVGMLRKVNLGGTVLGDGVGASEAYRNSIIEHLRELTGVELELRENLFDAAQNCDDLGAVAAQLGLTSELLIKLAQDLRLLSSGPEGGFGEIGLPIVMEGSSFYSGKTNPVVPETLIQCCFQVLGCERTARLALEHGELNLNVFEGAAAINILEAMEMLMRALAAFTTACVKGITANKARCRELASFARSGARKGATHR
jgi:aspartate ammonia-lyase